MLEYYKYEEQLTYQDVVRIRRTFFTGSYFMEHEELFDLTNGPLQQSYKNGLDKRGGIYHRIDIFGKNTVGKDPFNPVESEKVKKLKRF